MKYEDLAAHPLNFTREIYNLLGEEPSTYLLEAVTNHTMGGKSNGVLGTTRNNSTATSVAWKQSLKRDFQDKITAKCKKALIAYEYDI